MAERTEAPTLAELAARVAELEKQLAALKHVPANAVASRAVMMREAREAQEAAARAKAEAARERTAPARRAVLERFVAERCCIHPIVDIPATYLLVEYGRWLKSAGVPFAERPDESELASFVGSLAGVRAGMATNRLGREQDGWIGLTVAPAGTSPADLLAELQERSGSVAAEREERRAMRFVESEAQRAALERRVRRDEAFARLATAQATESRPC
jgi:hypothetical protein